MNGEVEWLCYHLVNEGLLSTENCKVIVDAIDEAGIEPDAETFVQVILDNNVLDDEAQLRQYQEMAVQEARSLGLPPENVLEGGDGESEGGSAVASSSARPAAGESAPESESRAAPRKRVSTAGADWLSGWPDLSKAPRMSDAEALDLLNEFLHTAREYDCSDVHLSAGCRPFVRRHKQIYQLPQQEVITPEVSEKLNLSPLTDEDREVFTETHDLDYSHAISEDDRYRTNLLVQRLGIAGSYRVIDSHIRSLEELGFNRPEVLEKLTSYHQGLILVTGPVGCGKSSTLASLVELINRTRQDHIVCVEDPIEVVFRPINCNVTQRELDKHTKSFSNALRAALREDPDIIVIGELRDLQTIEMAIRAAETGHLVIGTLHTSSASSTMDRLLDAFPPNQQAQIRAMAAESLKAVICQQLLPNADGTGVVLACEILLATLAVSNLIREGKTFQLDSTIQTSRNIGMTTMEQSYVDLYMQGKRTYEQTLPMVEAEDLVRQMQTHEAQQMSQAGHGEKGTKKHRWF